MSTEKALTTDQHTAGPWEYGPASNYHGFYISPRGTLPTLASVERCGQMVNVQVHNFPGSTEANARLIAAAPELYQFCREVMDWIQGVRYGRCVTDDMIQRLSVAMAKAEGKEHV